MAGFRLLAALMAGLFLGTAPVSGATTNGLLPAGSVWKYLDDGSDPGNAWREPAFDDAAWKSGPARFGFGKLGEQTVLGFGTNARSKHLTYYFRTTCEVADPKALTRVALGLLRDDGAVVYLNGAEVFRSNMPDGPVTRLTRASRRVSKKAGRIFNGTQFSASLLRPGLNHLAVEVHQDSPASPDLSFDLQLAGVFDPPVITRGPYVQQGGATNIIVRWRTAAPSDSSVRFGTQPAAPDSSAFLPAFTTEHEMALTGLRPGTKYFYTVGTWNGPVAGDDSFHFVTAPTNAQPTRLWVIGDSGIQDERPTRVFAAYTNFAAARRTDVWLLLGDNAYPNGTDAEYQTALFDRLPGLLRQTAAWTTIGNHETYSRAPAGFPHLEIFSPPRNGECGGVPSGTPRYYSFDHGNIHFVCLDSMTSDRSTNGAMSAWLRADLAGHTGEWLIAFWHHPPYSKGSHNSDRERNLMRMRENFVPLLEAAGADLVLCGHSHSYERSYFMQGHYGRSGTFTESMKVQPGSGREEDTGAYLKPVTSLGAAPGTVYVVAGSSGHASGGKLNHPAMFFSELELGSVVIDVDGPVLRAKFLRETGAEDDWFTMVKGGGNALRRHASRPRPGE